MKANALQKRLRRKGRFAQIYHEVFESPAYRDCRPLARALLVELLLIFTPQRNGRLQLAAARAADLLNVDKKTVIPAFHELAEHGLIAATRGDAWQDGQARQWRLTFEQCDGREPTDEWRQWEPGKSVFIVPKRTSRKQNAGGENGPEWGRKRTRVVEKTDHPPVSHPQTAHTIIAEPVEILEAPSAAPVAGWSVFSTQYNVPCGGADDASAAAIMQAAETIIAKPPARADRRGQSDAAPAIVADPRQYDLEEIIAAKSGQPITSGPTLADRLRADLAAHVSKAPPGELKRLAERVGLSRPQLSNFKSGTFGLNQTAAAMLRQILDEMRAA